MMITRSRTATALGWEEVRKARSPCIRREAGLSPGCTRAEMTKTGRWGPSEVVGGTFSWNGRTEGDESEGGERRVDVEGVNIGGSIGVLKRREKGGL